MDSVAVLEGEMPQVYQGNVLLDRIFGAQLIYDSNITQELEDQEIQGICPITSKVAESYRQRGKHPYLMPLGGATPCLLYTSGPQPDAAGHHHCHHDEGLHIEKLEEEVQLLLVGADAGRVFVH